VFIGVLSGWVPGGGLTRKFWVVFEENNIGLRYVVHVAGIMSAPRHERLTLEVNPRTLTEAADCGSRRACSCQ
jgi:hypothetical protein